ncbi:Imm1 family immunity protein [Amycolatopsis japonica]|uniref:Imm1 family immunity protein n=1 Tax=Amycolatopsis japonica TaxID=208439 RepID=UPI0037899E65
MAVLDIWHEQVPKGEGGNIRVSAVGMVVDHVYLVNHNEVPASVEVPMPAVRRGLHEFLATDARPSDVENDAK